MNVSFTNYGENPNECCVFCGKPQHTHFISIGSLDGQRYAHHFPCDAQMQALGAGTASRKNRLPRFLEQWFTSKAS